ncbi:glycosyltransferase [Kineococcus sp. R8]|nr:glycosyltransferase [Kineococcus siccus]NAZ83433.1 glycosyltransferase [Kineococcus siccus]
MVAVVPARDEELLVRGCVTALLRAARRCPVPVDVVVVADRCRDATADVARAAGARVVVPPGGRGGGGVGAARAAGAAAALAGLDPDTTWIACTDADSRVRACWLRHQLEHARRGADLVLGLVRLPPDPGGGTAGWRRRYATGVRGDTHRHVHGANLGVRASAYLAAGGFAAVPAHEDVALAGAVRALPGARVVSAVHCPVLTSDRRAGRTPAGVAHDLRSA